jgi:amino acid transporter
MKTFNVIMLVVSILVGLFTAFVVFDVSTLYNIEQISSLGFVKIYATISLITLVLYKRDKSVDEEKTTEEKRFDTVKTLLENIVLNLFVWGFMYLMHFILI